MSSVKSQTNLAIKSQCANHSVSCDIKSIGNSRSLPGSNNCPGPSPGTCLRGLACLGPLDAGNVSVRRARANGGQEMGAKGLELTFLGLEMVADHCFLASRRSYAYSNMKSGESTVRATVEHLLA